MRRFAIVIRRAYFEAKKLRKYAKNVVVNRSETGTLANSEDPNSGISSVSALFIKIFNNLQVKIFII